MQEQLDGQTEQWRQEVKTFCGGLRSRLDQLRAQCDSHLETCQVAEAVREELQPAAIVERTVRPIEPVEVEEADRIQQLKRSLADRIAARQKQ